MYVKDIQRDIGLLSMTPTLYRQDHLAHAAAAKIQHMWRSHRDTTLIPFHSWYGYHPNLCATKIQKILRGHQARTKLPMMRMFKWIDVHILRNYTEV